MIPMRPVEQINEKRLRRSIQAYLEGEQNLRWVLGEIGRENGLALDLLGGFHAFAGIQRSGELKTALEALIERPD